MWIEAGQIADAFWQQTPRSFQFAMRGIRRRMKADAENRTAQAWQTAAFVGSTQSKGGLKPLSHYLKRPAIKMSDAEMLANMRALAARVNAAD